MGTELFNLRAHVRFYLVLVLDEVVPKSILAKQGIFNKNIHKSLKNEGNQILKLGNEPSARELSKSVLF